MGALGLRKVSLLVIGRGRLPRHAAGGLLGFRVLIVAVLCGSICTVACQPVHVCRIGVVWSLFCSGLGDCCPIFALFARGRADRSALTIHLLRSCWDPPFPIWFPGRLCSRGTLRVSSMLSPTNQSAARRLSSGTKNN